jgi:hypothetical protein
MTAFRFGGESGLKPQEAEGNCRGYGFAALTIKSRDPQNEATHRSEAWAPESRREIRRKASAAKYAFRLRGRAAKKRPRLLFHGALHHLGFAPGARPLRSE